MHRKINGLGGGGGGGELEKNGGNQKRIVKMVHSSKSRSFVSLIPV